MSMVDDKPSDGGAVRIHALVAALVCVVATGGREGLSERTGSCYRRSALRARMSGTRVSKSCSFAHSGVIAMRAIAS